LAESETLCFKKDLSELITLSSGGRTLLVLMAPLRFYCKADKSWESEIWPPSSCILKNQKAKVCFDFASATAFFIYNSNIFQTIHCVDFMDDKGAFGFGSAFLSPAAA